MAQYTNKTSTVYVEDLGWDELPWQKAIIS